MIELVKTFGGEKCEQYNAMFTALVNASHTWTEANGGVDVCVDPPDEAVYPYLDQTPKASLIVELVTELNQLGFEIKKKE